MSYGLQKNYEWQASPPKRKKKNPEKTKKDNHHQRRCPMDAYRFIGIKLGRHLQKKHGLGKSNYYYYYY